MSFIIYSYLYDAYGELSNRSAFLYQFFLLFVVLELFGGSQLILLFLFLFDLLKGFLDIHFLRFFLVAEVAIGLGGLIVLEEGDSYFSGGKDGGVPAFDESNESFLFFCDSCWVVQN